jgi:hypothetical protein
VFELLSGTRKSPVKSVIKAETAFADSSHVGSGGDRKVMNLQFLSAQIA